MDQVDAIVIGAGVVGLASARALARRGREVLVLEAAADVGTGVSARNSEVMHAGLYYAPGSLKGRFCFAGRAALAAYCETHHIPYRRTGKLIVAADETQLGALTTLAANARNNGVEDLQLLDAAEAVALEPEVRCAGALLSPSTGIIDSRALMLALRAELEAAGGAVVLNTRVIGGRIEDAFVAVEAGDESPTTVAAPIVVNAAGLGAQALAAAIRGCDPRAIPSLHLARGNYFSLRGRSPFSRLVYPVPAPGGLGIHATLDLSGRTRFGPDVEWIDTPDYRVNEARAAAFYGAIRSYWPGLPDGALVPDYCGIRPKIERPGGSSTDFCIRTESRAGGATLVNLYGIESPGLTSSLALGDYVADLAEGG